MIDDNRANELAWLTKKHYDKMIAKGFSPGQVVITNIMISVSQYSLIKGGGAVVAVITSCLNAFLSDDSLNITEIEGYNDKSLNDDLKDSLREKVLDEKINKNIIYPNFKHDDNI